MEKYIQKVAICLFCKATGKSELYMLEHSHRTKKKECPWKE